MTSRTTRVIGGAGIGYIHQAGVILLGLWLTPFLLRNLGQHDYGLWLVAGQLLGYLALLDLGVLAILPREVAQLSGQPDKLRAAENIAALLARVRHILTSWLLPALAAACMLVLWWLPAEWADLRSPLAPVFIAFVALYPFRILLAALQGVQEMPLLAASQLAGWVVGTLTTIVLVWADAGLYALAAGWVIATAVPAAIAWWRGRQLWPRTPPDRPHGPASEIFRSSLWISVGQVAQVLLSGSDVLLVGRLLGPAAVVPYACTGKLVTVFANHPHLLMHVAQPALAELRTSASRERLRHVSTALMQTMLLMSGGLAVVILPLNHAFVDWWVGPTQYGGWGLTLAFTAMMVLRHLGVSFIYTLFCFGYERQISVVNLADGLITIAASAAMITSWGLIGAPLGSIAGVVVSLAVNGRAMAREMGTSGREFAASVVPILLRILAVGAIGAAGAQWIGAAALPWVVVLTLSMAALFLGLVLPLAWDGPVGPYLRHAVHLARVASGRVASEPRVDPDVVGDHTEAKAGV
jgi:O-antigen/teichoic acid export membrane protein